MGVKMGVKMRVSDFDGYETGHIMRLPGGKESSCDGM